MAKGYMNLPVDDQIPVMKYKGWEPPIQPSSQFSQGFEQEFSPSQPPFTATVQEPRQYTGLQEYVQVPDAPQREPITGYNKASIKETTAYYSHKVREISQWWHDILGIRMPNGDRFNSKPNSMVPSMDDKISVLDLDPSYGPPPERWRGENLGMTSLLDSGPDVFDAIRASAIIATQDTIAISDFFTDITHPYQQASIAKVHNDLTWAHAVLDEYSRKRGFWPSLGAGVAGGIWSLPASPLELFAGGFAVNLGAKLSIKVGGPIAAKILQYGSTKLGKAAATVGARAVSGVTTGAGWALGAGAKRQAEWQFMVDRVAEEQGIPKEEAESHVLEIALSAGVLGGGLSALLKSNRAIIREAMPEAWNKVFGDMSSRAYTNLVDSKLDKLYSKFMSDKKAGQTYTAQDWQDFLIKEYTAKPAEATATTKAMAAEATAEAPVQVTAKGSLEHTTIFNLEDRFKIDVEGNRASYNIDFDIKSEADLGSEYANLFVERIKSLGTDYEQAATFLGRTMRNITDISSSLEKMKLNIMYEGLTKEDSKILYKNSINDEFNRYFYDAVVGRDPTKMKGLSNGVSNQKFVRNVLDVNKKIVNDLRKRGVAVSELEEGYLRQTHDTYRISSVSKEDWVDYTFSRLDKNKSFKEIYDRNYQTTRIAELEKDIEGQTRVMDTWKAKQEYIQAEIKAREENIKRLKGIKEKTAEERAQLKGEALHARTLRYMLSDTTDASKELTKSKASREILRRDLKDYIKIAKEIRRTKAAPNPVLKLIRNEQEAALKALKKPAKTAQERKDRAKGQIEAIRNIRKVLKDNNITKGELSRHAEQRAEIKMNLNLARKSIQGAANVHKKMLKEAKKLGKDKVSEVQQLFELNNKRFQEYADLMEKKANDAKGKELKGWVEAAKAFRNEINDLAALADEAKIQGAIERDYNARIREHERNIERLKQEAIRSTEKDRKAIEKEARQFEKEAEALRKDKDKVENKISNIKGSLEKIRDLKRELTEQARSAEGMDLDQESIALREKAKNIRQKISKVREEKIKHVPDPNTSVSELVKFYENRHLEEVARDTELLMLKKELSDVTAKINEAQEKRGGLRGKAILEKKLLNEIKVEQRKLAKNQRELLREIRSSRNRREIRDNKRKIREYQVEKAMLEANSKLKPDEQAAMARGILGDTYVKITEEGSDGSIRIGGVGKYHKQRELHFKDFNSWNSYQQDYGHRMSALQATLSHVQSSSKRLAALEMLGPTPHTLKQQLKPIIDNLRRQKLPSAARLQLNLFDQVTNNLLHFDPTNPTAGTGIGFKVVDNLNTFAAADLLKNVSKFAVLFEPVQAAFWAQRYGLEKKGILFSQVLGLKNALRSIGVLGKKGAEMLRLIPAQDKNDMVLAGFIYHNTSSYIEGAHTSQTVTRGMAKFSKKMGQVFGSDLSMEVGHTATSTLWSYRVGEWIRARNKYTELDPSFQKVLIRYGISEADWDSILTSRKGMVSVNIFKSNKSNGVKAKHFSAMKMFREATTPEEADLARKMFYAQNSFTRDGAMQGDPIITAAVKSMMAPKNANTMLGQIALRTIDAFFTFGGYSANLASRLAQHGLEDIGGKSPGVKALMQWMSTLMAASFVTNALMDIMKGKEVKLNEKTVLKAVTTAGGMGPMATLIWEQFENLMGDQGSLENALVKTTVSKFVPIGMSYALNKAGHTLKAFSDFASGDNARAIYHARRAMPFIDWFPTDLIANRLILDNIFYNLDPSAAYRSWIMDSQAAMRSGKPYSYENRPGSWVTPSAPDIVDNKAK